MNDKTIPLATLVDALAVMREIHALVGPDPRAGIPGKLYTRLVSAEAALGSYVDRIARSVAAEVQ